MNKHVIAFIIGNAAVWAVFAMIYVVVEVGLGWIFLSIFPAAVGYCAGRAYLASRGIY